MERFRDCYLKREGEIFLLGNSKIERRISTGEGSFYTISYDKEHKKEWLRKKR